LTRIADPGLIVGSPESDEPMGSSAEAPVQVGQLLAGKFRVERVLGAGGMGVVVAATHLVLRKQVALKFLLPSASTIPGVVERFLREARSASAIESEHVAKVIDVGTLEESGSPYMVMEFLSGRDLEHVLKAQGTLPVEAVVDYLLQVCEALAEAHGLGIVHRDLKPANLFLVQRADGSPLVKVLDFGIAKALHDAEGSQSLTQTAGWLGSPLYMSPEQLKSPKGVDSRTDIWSLGIILHELLTGATPFEAETVHALSAAILMEPPRPLRAARPELPEALEAVVASCLEKDRNRRFQTVADLAEALSPFAASPSAALSIERVSRTVRGSRASLTVAPADAPRPGVVPATAALRPSAPVPTLTDEGLHDTRQMTAAVGPSTGARTTGGLAHTQPEPPGKQGFPRAIIGAAAAGAVALLGLGGFVLTRGEQPAAASGLVQPASPLSASAPAATSSPPAVLVAPVDAPAASAAPPASAASTTPTRPAPPGAAGPARKPARLIPAPPPPRLTPGFQGQ
jgi:eukaryotic-like serine/threonine-protein kinase